MNKPDFEIEQFWFGLKASMINFYDTLQNSINRPINKWSDNLNNLQKREKYDDIEKNIRNYISLYGIDVMRNRNIYHLSILKTNIKRWNIISKQFNFNKNDSKKYFNIIFLLLDIYETLFNKLNNDEFICFSNEIELLIMYEDFNYLIEVCIKHKLESILDKLSNYIDLIKVINNKYNLDIKNNYSGRKLLKVLQQYNLLK